MTAQIKMLADAMAVLTKSAKNKETNVSGGNDGGIDGGGSGVGGCSGRNGSGSDCNQRATLGNLQQKRRRRLRKWIVVVATAAAVTSAKAQVPNMIAACPLLLVATAAAVTRQC